MLYRSLTVAVTFLLAILVASFAQAQTETALARKVYTDINSRLGELVRVAFVVQQPNVEYRSNVRAWSDAEGVRKLEVTDPDDDGDVIGEYFFERGQLVFYFSTLKGYTETGRLVARSETRQYFSGGRMFKWLAGMDSKSNATPPSSTEFIEEEQSRIASASFYHKAANDRAAQRRR
jgi:hypothetical protein